MNRLARILPLGCALSVTDDDLHVDEPETAEERARRNDGWRDAIEQLERCGWLVTQEERAGYERAIRVLKGRFT